MIRIILLAAFLLIVGCKETPDSARLQKEPTASLVLDKQGLKYGKILAPLVDPTKLDALKGKRAGTKRLRKASYWLEIGRREGFSLQVLLEYAHNQVDSQNSARREAQIKSLVRNNTILNRLGCLDTEGMVKLRKGNAPTIKRGPYSGELATADHIIPRSVCPELDNRLFNLEFMPQTLNQRKSNRISQRQVDLAKRWNEMGLLSGKGLQAVSQRAERN